MKNDKLDKIIVSLCIFFKNYISIVKEVTIYMIYNNKTINKYFSIWALFIPISSFLLIPSVQGTTPGYIFAFLSIIIVFFAGARKINSFLLFMSDIIKFLFVFVLLNAISQLILAFSTPADFSKLILIDKQDTINVLLRPSLFTQSLYIIPGVITFAFVKRFYNKKWDKPLFISIAIFALYGIYEFLYFLIFKEFGDFISNRNFSEHDTVKLGTQLMTIGSFVVQRVKSLAPEPSMYAFTVLPFWIYSIHTGRKTISYLLLFTMFLGASTTAIIGILIYYTLRLLSINKLKLFFISGFGFVLTLIFWDQIYLYLDKAIISKFTLDTQSGIDRYQFFKQHMVYFLDMNFFSQLFGMGFGFIRSTDFFSTLLVNNGLVGFIAFTALFFYPIFSLRNNDKRVTALKIAIFIIYMSMMISVPEFSYLTIWLFLGIAYSELSRQKKGLIE